MFVSLFPTAIYFFRALGFAIYIGNKLQEVKPKQIILEHPTNLTLLVDARRIRNEEVYIILYFEIYIYIYPQPWFIELGLGLVLTMFVSCIGTVKPIPRNILLCVDAKHTSTL